MCLVANQLISFKEFSDKLNMILKEFSLIFSEKDLKTVVSRVNKFLPSIFAAERANLWIVDSMTGSLYSFAEIIEKRCLMHKGIISEVFFYRNALNVKNAKTKPLLYRLDLENYKEQ